LPTEIFLLVTSLELTATFFITSYHPHNRVSSAAVHPSVLIVEDNIISMMLLSTFVSKRAYSFETAVNGMEAYQAVQQRPEGFNVILMGHTVLPFTMPLSLT
jgi:PleD family two-component response regulator